MNGEGNPLNDVEDLLVSGQTDRAVIALQAYFEDGHSSLAARLMMGRALMDDGRMAEALEWGYETIRLYPDVAEAAVLTGTILLTAERPAAAIGELQRALRLAPDDAPSRILLGRAWLEAGEAQKALEQFAYVDADTPVMRGLRAEAERILGEVRSDAKYVRYLFDDFSATYDSHMLKNLQYRAPRALRALFDLIGGGRDGLAVLDLGCGTGLAGAVFRETAARLTGVDLSPRMIAAAKKRKIYDVLCVSDIEELAFEDACFDLALAADTLVYLGDLSLVLHETNRVLKNDGLLLFSVEKKDGDSFDLGPKRRWRHSESYLRAAAAAAGFDVVGLMACSPRTEAGAEVAGFATALQKKDKTA